MGVGREVCSTIGCGETALTVAFLHQVNLIQISRKQVFVTHFVMSEVVTAPLVLTVSRKCC